MLTLLFSMALAQDEVDPAAGEALPGESVVEAVPAVTAGHFTATLANGLRVTVLSDPDHKVVATQIWVAVGSAHEAQAELGFAHLFEHLMFGATELHDKEAYSRLHTVNGGRENAYTMFDNTVYLSEIAPEHHDALLALEAERFSKLLIDQDNLDNEKKIVTEELRISTENDPFSRVAMRGLAALFGDHPYAHSPAGTKADIAGADLDLVRKFYDGYYRPENLHLVVAGPVHGPTTLATIEALFGGLPADAATPPEVVALSAWDFPDDRIVLKEDLPPIKLAAQVYPLPAPSEQGYWASALLMEMVVGGEVDLFRHHLVEEQGKAIEALTFHEELEAGAIAGFASVSLPFRSQAKAFKLLSATRKHLDQLDWATEERLQTAKRRMLQAELEAAWFAEDQAHAVGIYADWWGDESLALGGAAEAIDAVTLEQVHAAWNDHIAGAEPVEIFIARGKAEEAK